MESLDNPRFIIALLVVAGVGYGGWAFYENSQSEIPHRQVDKTNVKEFPPYRINLWSDPMPPRTGKNTISVEIDFVNLMNNKIGSVQYSLINLKNPDTVVQEKIAKFRSSGAYKGRYIAKLKIPNTGRWLLKVHSKMNKYESTAKFEFEIKN